jgi:hypothetical protein
MISPMKRFIGFAIIVSFLPGCSQSGPKLMPVSGVITLTTGPAIKHGYVNFHPDANKGNRSKDIGIGFIRDGKFTILSGDREGLLPGWYVITVDAANETDPKNPYVNEWYAEERYTDKRRSQLSVEVKEGAVSGAYDLKLKPHPKAKRS